MRIKTIISAIVLLSFFCSCSVSRKQNQVSRKQNQEIIQQNQETVSYHNFNAQYKGSYNSIPFKVQLRGTHDSIIWCSITTFLGEIGRAQITKDSIYLMDKINSDAYIISKKTISENSGQEIDNKTVERFITDTVNSEIQFEFIKPLAVSLLVKKEVENLSEEKMDIEAKLGKNRFKIRLTKNSIEYDKALQFPFSIPNKYNIKRQ
ncbi:MAG: DUF4292 domain-containing protein [Bacteroidales bacterium]|nr:DUF4292 domain-containing protein [Bacteroidales bacterium]